MTYIDLHTHSTASDGTFTPTELIHYAQTRGLSSIALTDHDTVAGIKEAVSAALKLSKEAKENGTSPITVIPGIELSSDYNGTDIHIVGLYINYDLPWFDEHLVKFRDSREERNEKMCALLREHGIDITYKQLTSEYPDCVITRAHFKEFLLKHGYVKSAEEAFSRYIGDHAPCFLPREKISPEDAVRFIRKAGGVPVFAHPMLCKFGRKQLDDLVARLKDAGLEGIEAYYSTYNGRDERIVKELAEKYSLALSGGSDFHGKAKKNIDLGYGQGNLPISEDLLPNLKKRRPVRYLFTDMDGTLFNDRKEITPKTYTELSRISSHGHHIVFASGRSLDSMKDVLVRYKLNFPGSFISAYNGAMLYDCDRDLVLSECRVPRDTVKDILSMAEEIGVHCQTYSDDSVLSLYDTEELNYYCGIIKRPKVVGPSIWQEMVKDPCKVIAIQLRDRAKEDKLLLLQKRVMEKYGDTLSSVFSCPEYVEFFPCDAGKGNSLKKLCSILNIPVCDTIAAGDEENDISMLEAAGIGCAMLNGTDAAKAAADYITKNTNNHDAVGEIAELFIQD